MTPPNVSYSAALMLAGIACLVVNLIILQTRRSAPGAPSLFILMCAVSWWDLTYSLFWAKAPAPYPNFWLYVTFIGAVAIPAGLLVFAVQITEHQHWLKRPLLLGLSIEPLLVIILLFTDSWHGLFFGGQTTQGIGMILHAGPIYWMNIVYSYVLVLIACVLLIHKFLRTSGIYRKQIGTILIGIAIPWLNSFVFIFGFSPFPNADNTPLSFTIAGLAFSYALLHYHLLEILPIARYALVESMSDGVMVLDTHNRLVDLNPAAKQVLGKSGKVIGEPIEVVLSRWPELVETFFDVNEIRTEVCLNGPGQSFLDLKISSLHDARHNFIGRLVVWRDITSLKKAQTDLQELAAKDYLTDSFNRRYFLEMMDKEVQRAHRLGHPLAVILFDFDHFKYINDTFGHLAGDQVLKTTSDISQKYIRNMDLFGRFGGDEFMILLPETDLARVREVAGRIMTSLHQTPIEIDGEKIFVTVSMGISSTLNSEDTTESILKRTDQALYKAKEAGGNQIVVWDESLLPEQ